MARLKKGDKVVEEVQDPYKYRVGVGVVVQGGSKSAVVRFKTSKGTSQHWTFLDSSGLKKVSSKLRVGDVV